MTIRLKGGPELLRMLDELPKNLERNVIRGGLRAGAKVIQQQAGKAIIRAVRAAAAGRIPAIDGLTDVTVHTDSAGPDFLDEETGIHMQTQDFRVSFNEAR